MPVGTSTLTSQPPAADPGREFTFSDEQFRFLAGLASEKTGIVLAANKKDMIYGRLVRRLRALNLKDFDAYCALMRGPAGELELGQFINSVTTNLTRLFREPHHFEMLAAQLSALVQKGTRELRIWSAGCSSGMEPYSIAATLAHTLPRGHAIDAKILATDIDSGMLQTGERGDYPTPDLKDIPAFARKYLTETPDGDIHMATELKQLITFKQLNLLDPWPMRRQYDVIFCRNVVIYFDKPTKQRMFDRMADRLKPDGLLYIGHSENLNGICDRFQLVGRTVYRRVR